MMQSRILIILCLVFLVSGCAIRQAERDELKAQKTLLEEQKQIEKVEKQIKDLKEATDY